MAKFSFGNLISGAVKAADKAMKSAAKERDKQAKVAVALRVKAEKDRIKLEQKLAKTQKTVVTSTAYGNITKPKTCLLYTSPSPRD